ncbi:hypothetical protein EJ110_NYTH45593 [Nymphaea thermarum]|nr:hypothetical protein EJ110_NYTH45593 [Nymphaea thermarum]
MAAPPPTSDDHDALSFNNAALAAVEAHRAWMEETIIEVNRRLQNMERSQVEAENRLHAVIAAVLRREINRPAAARLRTWPLICSVPSAVDAVQEPPAPPLSTVPLFPSPPSGSGVAFGSFGVSLPTSSALPIVTPLLHPQHGRPDWRSLIIAMALRFGPSAYIDYNIELSKIRQKGTVVEYQESFKELSNMVRGWPTDAFIGTFVGGLKEEIRIEVQSMQPLKLHDYFVTARMVEEKHR